MRELGQTSPRESVRDVLLDWLRWWKSRNATELRYQAGKRQVNEPKVPCEQPVIPFGARKQQTKAGRGHLAVGRIPMSVQRACRALWSRLWRDLFLSKR